MAMTISLCLVTSSSTTCTPSPRNRPSRSRPFSVVMARSLRNQGGLPALSGAVSAWAARASSAASSMFSSITASFCSGRWRYTGAFSAPSKLRNGRSPRLPKRSPKRPPSRRPKGRSPKRRGRRSRSKRPSPSPRLPNSSRLLPSSRRPRGRSERNPARSPSRRPPKVGRSPNFLPSPSSLRGRRSSFFSLTPNLRVRVDLTVRLFSSLIVFPSIAWRRIHRQFSRVCTGSGFRPVPQNGPAARSGTTSCP